MLEIQDKNGKVISKSRNLRGIREYLSKSSAPIEMVRLYRTKTGGRFNITFTDGVHFACSFASFTVLKNTVRNWRNLYGARLQVDGVNAGEIGYHNKALYIGFYHFWLDSERFRPEVV